jgi:type IV pilus assembly protein PilQ
MTRVLLAGILVLAAVAFAATGPAEAADAAAQLKGVKVSDLPSGLSVVIETSGPARYHASLIDTPSRIVIDMDGAYAAPKSRWTSTPDPIKEIRGSQWKAGTARIVVELSHAVPYRVTEGPGGLTLTLGPSQEQSKTAKGEPPTAVTQIPKANASVPTAAKSAAPKPDMVKPPAAKRDTPAVAVVSARTETPKTAEPGATTPKSDVAKSEGSAASASRSRSPKLEPAHSAATKPTPATPDVSPGAAEADATKASVRAAAAVPAVPPTPPVSPVRVAQATPTMGSQTQATNGSKLITLDFKDADVVNVLRLLAAEAGRNIAVGDDVKGKVSVSLRNVTWEQALDTILEARGLQKIEKGGVIRIVSNEQLAKEREALAKAEDAKRKSEIEVRTKMAEAQLKEAEAAAKKQEAELAAAEAAARGPLVEDVIRLSYADPDDVAKTLQGILGIPPEGTAPVQGAPLGVPAVPTVVPSGPPTVPNPALGQLPPLNTPAQPVPWAQPQLVSVSQDVLAKGITIRANKATNSIFLRLYKRDMERIKKLVFEYLDVPLPQVKIEARMEILDRTALEAIGVQWGGGGGTNAGKATLVGQGFGEPNTGGGIAPSNLSPANGNLSPLSSLLPISGITGLPQGGNLVNLPLSALPNAGSVLPAGGLAFGIVGTNFNINLALQALSNLGKTRTLARPEIVTVENNKASISLGEELPYATVSAAGTQIQFKEALLKLEVTPTVIKLKNDPDHKKIKMIVVVENNDRGQTVNLGSSGQPPAINRRKAETLVLLNEGERLVIGGVTTTKNQNTVNKVPLFGDIPVLGWLFKQRENFDQGRELVVFLTPTVLPTTVAGAAPAK